MSILGYDPARYHTGRAPIEAAALGLRLRPDQVAYRCNLVTVGDDGTMVDFAGGHPSHRGGRRGDRGARRRARRGASSDVEFHPGVQYRHILVAPADWADAECAPPHDLTDKPAVWPTGPAAAKLPGAHGRVPRRRRALRPARANQIWLWGQGFQPQMPSFAERYGLDAGLVTAVDLVRGLGVLTDIEVRRGRRRHRLVRHRLRGQARRRPPTPWRRRRPVHHPRRGHRRGRPRRRRRREGQGARELGPRASSPGWSRASTRSVRGGCCCCPTTPRRCELQDPHHRPGALPAGRLRRRRARAAPTPRPASPTPRRRAGHELMGRLVAAR